MRKANLIFTARSKGKDNFGERLQITTLFRGLRDLCHTKPFVAMNSTKPEREAGTRVQRTNHVISDARCDICICRIGTLRQQLFRVFVSLLHALQGFEMLLFQNRQGVRFHAGGQRQRKQTLVVLGIAMEAILG